MHERELRRGLGDWVGGGCTFAYAVICVLMSKKSKKKKKSNDASGHLLKGILAALGHGDPRWQWLQ